MIVWDVARGETREHVLGPQRGRSGDWTSPPTGARSTAQRSTRARSCGTSPAIGGSTGRSTPVRRSSSTTATGIRSASRSAPTVARVAVDAEPTAPSTSSTRRRSSGAARLRALRRLRRRGRLQPRRATARGHRQGRPGDALGRAHAAARGRRCEDCGPRRRHSPSRPTAACSPRPSSAARDRTIRRHGSVRVWDVRRRALTPVRFPPIGRRPHRLAGVQPRRQAARRRGGGGTGPRSATHTPAGSSRGCDAG